MAVGEKRNTGVISQVSWTDGVSQDVYYGLEHSFQYASNINCDDEMHGIKLSQKAEYAQGVNGNCQLVSCGGNGVIALPLDGTSNPRIFDHNSFSGGGSPISIPAYANIDWDVCPGVVFQDNFWFGASTDGVNALAKISNTGAGTGTYIVPYDHPDSTDDSISTPAPVGGESMQGAISAILNYNNSRLVVACGAGGNQPTSIWVYYPELDQGVEQGDTYAGRTGWKKVLQYEAGVTVIAMTCTFEYLKVRAVDEGWNTKVYYYQGNNNLRSTFVYNVVDLTGVRVTRVYSINGIDYYTASIDGTDGFVTLYKMVGNTPVELFHVRGGLASTDVNYKAPYFVGPCGIDAAYNMGKFYIADAYGLFQFTYNPQGYDKGYMKWLMRDQNHDISHQSTVQPCGVCYNQGYIYVSDSGGCWKIRAYATGKEGYQSPGVLISREYEGKEGGTITKMLDEIRLNYELYNGSNTGTIDVYVSPNNTWTNTHTFTEANGWYHVMSIDGSNKKTRTEKSSLFNNMGNGSKSSFANMGDWQTITYAIVINQTSNSTPAATPIVRQIDLRYHTKDKVNNVYDIQNS